MSVDVPVSIWRKTDGRGELGSGGEQNLETLSLINLVTLSGVQLVTLEGIVTEEPATEWTADDLPPDTQWRPQDGLSEFSNTGVNNIVDNLGVFLVDPSGVFIVDTGVSETLIPGTEWTEDDSL